MGPRVGKEAHETLLVSPLQHDNNSQYSVSPKTFKESDGEAFATQDAIQRDASHPIAITIYHNDFGKM
ncbi:MAG: hypothetical protein WBZ36_29360 [Candidatus Nitrosopolaris sp.]